MVDYFEKVDWLGWLGLFSGLPSASFEQAALRRRRKNVK